MEEKVIFKNKKGEKVVGILHKPENIEKPPIVVTCHGFGSSKDSNTYKTLASNLCKNGIAVLRFDFYGSGESQGKLEDFTISEGIEDLESALNYVETLNFVDKGRIGIFGSSMGGMISILGIAKKQNIFVMALKSPVSDLGYLKENSQTERTENFYEDGLRYDVYSEARKISCPVLIIHGNKDDSVPLEQSQKLIKNLNKAKQKSLEIIKGNDHYYSKAEHFQKMIDLSVEWFKRWML
jgi:dipeptidyl aminopeptidase/acylaminoacyl peptidase